MSKRSRLRSRQARRALTPEGIAARSAFRESRETRRVDRKKEREAEVLANSKAAWEASLALLPTSEEPRITAAVASAKPWHDEWSKRMLGYIPRYDPKLIVVGSDKGAAWRWALDVSLKGKGAKGCHRTRQERQETKVSPGEQEILKIIDCLASFGNVPGRKVVEADGSETFFAGNEVASRANAAGAVRYQLPDDTELGIVQIEGGVHCPICEEVFPQSEGRTLTGVSTSVCPTCFGEAQIGIRRPWEP